MTGTQNTIVIVTSVVAVTCIFLAAFDVRTSNGRTSRAFSNLLGAIALGIALVTVAEMAALGPSIGTALIVVGRLIQVGGVIYFVVHLRRKVGVHETLMPGTKREG